MRTRPGSTIHSRCAAQSAVWIGITCFSSAKTLSRDGFAGRNDDSCERVRRIRSNIREVRVQGEQNSRLSLASRTNIWILGTVERFIEHL